MLKCKQVAVIAAHPDDEILGCGGTIIRHVQEGAQVHVLLLAEGATSRGKESYEAELESLHRAAQAAGKIMGVASVTLHDFPDNKMDIVPLLEIVKCVELFLSEREYDVVYTHHVGDVNIDHQLTHQAVVTALRPIPGQHNCTLLTFETPSSTEWQPNGSGQTFVPNWFVNIEDSLPQKIEALAAYKMEMREWPHPRSLEGVEVLAKWRGASVGYSAAEAFMLARALR